MQQRTQRIGRRGLLLSGAAVGVGAITASTQGAQAARQSQGPSGIEWLDYNPPRPFAAGARVGNVVYLSGVIGTGADVAAQTESAFASIREGLQALGSDLELIFKMTIYLVDIADQAAFGQVRTRLLPRPVASTLVEISRLVPDNGRIEIEVMALVAEA